jgi:hypothetical protein
MPEGDSRGGFGTFVGMRGQAGAQTFALASRSFLPIVNPRG